MPAPVASTDDRENTPLTYGTLSHRSFLAASNTSGNTAEVDHMKSNSSDADAEKANYSRLVQTKPPIWARGNVNVKLVVGYAFWLVILVSCYGVFSHVYNNGETGITHRAVATNSFWRRENLDVNAKTLETIPSVTPFLNNLQGASPLSASGIALIQHASVDDTTAAPEATTEISSDVATSTATSTVEIESSKSLIPVTARYSTTTNLIKPSHIAQSTTIDAVEGVIVMTFTSINLITITSSLPAATSFHTLPGPVLTASSNSTLHGTTRGSLVTGYLSVSLLNSTATSGSHNSSRAWMPLKTTAGTVYGTAYGTGYGTGYGTAYTAPAHPTGYWNTSSTVSAGATHVPFSYKTTIVAQTTTSYYNDTASTKVTADQMPASTTASYNSHVITKTTTPTVTVGSGDDGDGYTTVTPVTTITLSDGPEETACSEVGAEVPTSTVTLIASPIPISTGNRQTLSTTTGRSFPFTTTRVYATQATVTSMVVVPNTVSDVVVLSQPVTTTVVDVISSVVTSTIQYTTSIVEVVTPEYTQPVTRTTTAIAGTPQPVYSTLSVQTVAHSSVLSVLGVDIPRTTSAADAAAAAAPTSTSTTHAKITATVVLGASQEIATVTADQTTTTDAATATSTLQAYSLSSLSSLALPSLTFITHTRSTLTSVVATVNNTISVMETVTTVPAGLNGTGMVTTTTTAPVFLSSSSSAAFNTTTTAIARPSATVTLINGYSGDEHKHAQEASGSHGTQMSWPEATMESLLTGGAGGPTLAAGSALAGVVGVVVVAVGIAL